MFSLRRPDIPGIVLALMVAVAFISLEASHSHAHQHLSGHVSATPHALVTTDATAAGHVLTDHHQHEEHVHLRLMATSTAKASVFHSPVVTTAAAPRPQYHLVPLPAVFVASSLLPGLLQHGPPPPSRAPPLV